MTLTLIDSIEAEIEKCKHWLIHEFGDHMSIHNSLADLREGVLKAASSVEPASTELEGLERASQEDAKGPEQPQS